MLPRLGVLTGTTGLLLALTVAIASPADARRNLGGTSPVGTICVQPGDFAVSSPPRTNVPCVCYIDPSLNNLVIRQVGRGPCPAGLAP